MAADIINHIDLSVLAVIIILFLLYDLSVRNQRQFLNYRLFIALLLADLVLLMLDIVSAAVNGQPGTGWRVANLMTQTIYYVIFPLPPFLWVLYAHVHIFSDEKRTKRLAYILIMPIMLYAILVIISPTMGSMLYLDNSNNYHRGLFFPLLPLYCYTYLGYAFIMVFKNRRTLEPRHIFPLLLFPIPPAIGGFLQIWFHGAFVTWPLLTLSLLITYNGIQNFRINTDYLTGVYNRLGFESFYKQKLRLSNTRKFAGLLIDIDNFKAINDTYGHLMGDRMLEVTAELLQMSLRKEDFIARYGGDEFIVILDIEDHQMLLKAVHRIKNNVKAYNDRCPDTPTLGLSIGYDIYEPALMNGEQFIYHIDALMYADKDENRVQLTC